VIEKKVVRYFQDASLGYAFVKCRPIAINYNLKHLVYERGSMGRSLCYELRLYVFVSFRAPQSLRFGRVARHKLRPNSLLKKFIGGA
jgi:hypothetical protein